MGQDGRADTADRLQKHQTSRSALQPDDDREQHRPNGSNAERSAARSDDMRPENELKALRNAVRDTQ